MIMSRNQNAGRSYSMKIDNSSIERVEIVPLKGCKSSNIWEQPQQIKILFRKKLRAD